MIDELDKCKTHEDVNTVFATILDHPKVKSLATYQRTLREFGTALWKGEIEQTDFISRFFNRMEISLGEAFNTGLDKGGITEDDLTAEEKSIFTQEVANERSFIPQLANYIVSNSRKTGGKLGAIRSRVDRWAATYSNIEEVGFLIAKGTTKLRWKYDPRKEHCTDCRRLNGRVQRAVVWLKNKVLPKSKKLACFGIWCGCIFEDTDEPLTRGRMPKLVGPN